MTESKISYKEYFDECRSVASEAIELASDSLEIYEVLHELIDNHQYIIFYWANFFVMRHTQNYNAFFDVGLSVRDVGHDDWHSVQKVFAFWAFKADVEQHLSYVVEERASSAIGVTA